MRRLMWFTLGFGAACAFGAYFYVDWLLTAGAVAVILALCLAVATYWLKHFRIGVAVCMGLAIGLCWFYTNDTMLLDNARAVNGQTLRTTVIVKDYSQEREHGCSVDGTVYLEGQSYAVRLYLNEDVALEPGNRVLGEFKFRITTGSAEDVLYHRGNGVFLLGYQRSDFVVERCWSVPLLYYPAVWRHDLQQTIADAFPEDTAGFAQALLLGERSGISYETSTAFKISGISHIIAVSGLHISILFGFIYFISAKRRGLTALIGIPAVLIFAAVAGFSPSVTRAAIMQIVMMLAMLLGREYDRLTSLSWAAVLMLTVNPLVISSVSFQLSFACMLGITLLSEPIRNWLMDERRLGRWRGRLTNWLSSGIAVSLSASVFTTPLVAVYFGTVSIVSILTNLLTVWIITLIFYGIMAVCLVGCFHTGLAAGIGWVIAWPIRYVLAVAEGLSSLPLAAVYTQSGYIVGWLVFVYVLLVIYLWVKDKPALLFASLAILTLCLSVAASWIEPILNGCRMTVLDVGQGQSILLQAEGKTFLVDCGGDYDDDAADIAAEKLLSMGIDRLDGIILTHYDGDHAGGVEYLLTRIDTELLLMPHSLDENGVGDDLRSLVGDKAVTVKEDISLSFGGAELAVFAPVSYNSGNESSMSLLFRAENCVILITGDMGEAGERLLLKTHQLPRVDALVVGHHGSKGSTSELLLDTVQPAYAFISVGEDNSYGHPAQLILDRLEEYGCLIYRTDEDGTIVYRG